MVDRGDVALDVDYTSGRPQVNLLIRDVGHQQLRRLHFTAFSSQVRRRSSALSRSAHSPEPDLTAAQALGFSEEDIEEALREEAELRDAASWRAGIPATSWAIHSSCRQSVGRSRLESQRLTFSVPPTRTAAPVESPR